MKSLIIWGGWDGHTPQETADVLAKGLRDNGVDVTVSDTLDSLNDKEALATYDLFTPVWTCGEFAGDQFSNLHEAVRAGMGIAGVHGGMGDAFRGCLEYQWMTGGQFVGHPHVGDYEVRLTAEGKTNPITKDLPETFAYNSEQYYMLVDPSMTVLAETTYQYDNQAITMPVMWTKTWGKGRVFYNALGHVAEEFTKHPDMLAATIRGMIWAAEGKAMT